MKYQLKIVSIAALAAVIAISVAAEDMVKLELELPKPLFAGTPKSIKTPNLERKPAVVEIMVPKGTVNIASGKEVSSSDDFPVIGELEYITDGDKEGADGSYVELGPGVQWVQIDLGEQKTIYAVALWHYHAQARAYRDVIIQVADDADFIENVQTVFNNDHDNSAGLGIGKDKEYIETNKGRLVDTYGLDVLVPNEKEMDVIHQVIYSELCLGKIDSNSRKKYLDIIDRLKGEGAEGVILGCTEIGLLIKQEDTDIPLFDTAEIHARTAVDFALR